MWSPSKIPISTIGTVLTQWALVKIHDGDMMVPPQIWQNSAPHSRSIDTWKYQIIIIVLTFFFVSKKNGKNTPNLPSMGTGVP